MENEFCFNLAMRKATRLINQLYQERFNTIDLKSGQFSIIKAVHHLKETTNSELQGILVLDQTTLSRNLKPLIRDEYLFLAPDKNDQRIKKISLTKKGEALYKKALPLWKDAQTEMVKRLGQDNASNILNLSEKFIESLG